MKVSSIFYCLIILLFSCKKNISKKRIKTTIIDSLKNKNEQNSNKSFIFFNNNKIELNQSKLANKNSKSVNIIKGKIKGKYLYCGKAIPNSNILFHFKKFNLDYSDLKKYKTGHNILIDNDTIHIQGTNKTKCKKNNTNVILNIKLYQFLFENDTTNYPVIESMN